MLKAAGGLLSAQQVAELLLVAPATVRTMADHGDLLAITNHGQLGYPSFQFVDGRVIPHLSEVLALLDTPSNTTKLGLLMTVDSELEGNAAAALREGRSIELVKRKARQFGRQLAKSTAVPSGRTDIG